MIDKAKSVAELLKVLANEYRLLALCALVEKPLTVNEIYEFTPNISKSALSQHLHHLKLYGIVDSNKNGLNVIYNIADERVLELLEVLKEKYC
ncbi:MAG: metalloregulator ArsR/SmtB family transcription factor [Anaerovoracaceae bacterium]